MTSTATSSTAVRRSDTGQRPPAPDWVTAGLKSIVATLSGYHEIHPARICLPVAASSKEPEIINQRQRCPVADKENIYKPPEG